MRVLLVVAVLGGCAGRGQPEEAQEPQGGTPHVIWGCVVHHTCGPYTGIELHHRQNTCAGDGDAAAEIAEEACMQRCALEVSECYEACRGGDCSYCEPESCGPNCIPHELDHGCSEADEGVVVIPEGDGG